ncbi:sn-glycerol-3-phosphate ABC transporter ATP-binding protein UgpC (plasmid) [Skermanella sp. TT6]|uniref:Sn-glycerol-3-phosphate ABC transporter ATP-binding protein UgpC n=1 Tax=Skermanella cutis TaxID=2775420 RepID=A0ABX7BKA1_9PROT|nr:sn-glycerol-3-phosphate ABC transporter ATP-binding protein UgpC [Skermanella sp. TT6]QQP93664.1 sn-glycerol-3-phosphate ABC transporter ATP-binding protein UgpC [Skermanella sp. TT6]
MATVTLRNIRKKYGEVEVIKGVDLDVADREFVVFVGPSGCGKSTLLRMIAGLESITDGDLTIDGVRANDIGPADRGLAMVFQSYALYPHMTVADNMAFSLRLAGVSKEERMRKVTEAANVLHLGPLLERRPKELSGGQRQRVAIGRAIVRQPKVFLFDEPLSNLDAALRVQMRIELAKLHEKLEATMIYVTHDQIEAMTMADKIVVLQGGVVEQVGSPLELYHHPRNLFVAGFIGSPKMNLMPGRAIGRAEAGITVELANGIPLSVPVKADRVTPGDEVTVGIRPEHLRLTPDGEIAGTVLVTERLGGLTFLHIQVPGDMVMIVQADGDEAASIHDHVKLTVNPRGCHLFGRDGMAVEHMARHHLIEPGAAGRRSA